MTLSDPATALNEKRRTYTFPQGEKIILENVIELIVRPSGSHRLKTADGKLHVVATGWLSITIEDDSHDWTV